MTTRQNNLSTHNHRHNALFGRIQRLGIYADIAWTMLFYRPLFKHIGSRTIIRRPLYIGHPEYISLGSRVFIRDGVRLEAVPAHPWRIPELVIGDGTNIEQHVHIICHSKVHIGKQVSITGHCAIVDVTHPYEDVSDPTQIGARIKDEDAFVEIGDGAFIGFGSVILPNVRIGRKSVIGANSVVASHIPDYSVAIGSPARVIRRYDHAQQQWRRV